MFSSKTRHSFFLVKGFFLLTFTFLIYLIITGIISAPARAAYMFASDVVYDEVTDNPTSYLKSIGSNGAASDIGQIGASGSVLIQGLSESPYPGKVYGAQTEGQKELWKIDVTTGGGEIVGSFGSDIKELAYDPVHDILYGTDFERLYTINQSTGAAVPKAKRFDEDLPTGTDIDLVWALAYDTVTGGVYGVDDWSNNLFRADTSTGAATLIGYVSTGPDTIALRDGVTDIAFDRQTGVLYGIEKEKDPNYFFTIDINDQYEKSGNTYVPTTNIGVLGEPINVLGLAKPIPEPFTFLLFGSGLLSLTWLARKKSDKKLAL
ncbi:MAG: hypothetical protein GXO98_06860 [Nitrospirae bacterium]|nr:hypothetical protein [Nitrospirota bacterium]